VDVWVDSRADAESDWRVVLADLRADLLVGPLLEEDGSLDRGVPSGGPATPTVKMDIDWRVKHH
ncbi:hypothetical protein GOODEAATRI_034595, partial [Goodea atripinnis]